MRYPKTDKISFILKDCNQDYVAYCDLGDDLEAFLFTIIGENYFDREGPLVVWFEEENGEHIPVAHIDESRNIKILEEGY